jgi:stearoyl-CoA desaturase (delta-9 desaturase)
MALFTFGEGYHNYHHEFPHDYRNGVKPWEWDPTKWVIWILSKLGLVGNLRRVAREAIESAQLREIARASGSVQSRTGLKVSLSDKFRPEGSSAVSGVSQPG